jgi:hypothetical protein
MPFYSTPIGIPMSLYLLFFFYFRVLFDLVKMLFSVVSVDGLKGEKNKIA